MASKVWASEPQQAHARDAERFDWLDTLRGIAIIAMAIYHFTWDLTFFHYIAASSLRTTAFVLFGHTIACSFLGIAGLALALASHRQRDLKKFWLRLAKISAAAALVTLATWIAFPASYVNFGILHCIAAASLISLLFTRLPWWVSAFAGVVIFGAGLMIEWPMFDSVNSWIGLGETIPLTNDWRPIFPWAGAMLLGLAAGQWLQANGMLQGTMRAAVSNPAARTLALTGRYSLSIYLIHQPVLFALVWLGAQMFPPQSAAGIHPQPFVNACVERCVKASSPADYCSRTCGCIAEQTRIAGIWNNVASGTLNAAGQERYGEIVAMCRRSGIPAP